MFKCVVIFLTNREISTYFAFRWPYCATPTVSPSRLKQSFLCSRVFVKVGRAIIHREDESQIGYLSCWKTIVSNQRGNGAPLEQLNPYLAESSIIKLYSRRSCLCNGWMGYNWLLTSRKYVKHLLHRLFRKWNWSRRDRILGQKTVATKVKPFNR